MRPIEVLLLRCLGHQIDIGRTRVASTDDQTLYLLKRRMRHLHQQPCATQRRNIEDTSCCEVQCSSLFTVMCTMLRSQFQNPVLNQLLMSTEPASPQKMHATRCHARERARPRTEACIRTRADTQTQPLRNPMYREAQAWPRRAAVAALQRSALRLLMGVVGRQKHVSTTHCARDIPPGRKPPRLPSYSPWMRPMNSFIVLR